jgi:hypothetical protein
MAADDLTGAHEAAGRPMPIFTGFLLLVRRGRERLAPQSVSATRFYACIRSAWAYHSHASALPAFAARRASGQPLMMPTSSQ